MFVCVCSEGQSAAIPVASMEFAAICLRNALLLLPEHQQLDSKSDGGSKSCSQSGSTESCGETVDSCRYPLSFNKSTFTEPRCSDALRLILDAVLSRPADLLLWLTAEKPRRETSSFLQPPRPPWESRRWRTSGEITVDCFGMNASRFVMLRKQPGDFWNDCFRGVSQLISFPRHQGVLLKKVHGGWSLAHLAHRCLKIKTTHETTFNTFILFNFFKYRQDQI